MNVRTSAVLLIALALVAGYVFFVQIREPFEPSDEPPWFFSIDMDDISRITVTNMGEEATFFLGRDQRWFFDEPDGLPVDDDAWQGVVLLLSGPKADRVILEEEPIDLDPYGLDYPPTRIEIELKNGEKVPILLGLYTPDGVGVYAQLEGIPTIFTVVVGWEDVMTRLIDNPPYPKWYYNIDTSLLSVIELEQEGQVLTLTKEDDVWYFGDAEKTPVEEAQLGSILASLVKPSFQRLAESRATDVAQYGLDTPSFSLFLTTRERQTGSVILVKERIFYLGQPTEDGKSYYGQVLEAEDISDVFLVDARWVESLQAVLAQPSYPHTTNPESTG